ncbi:hypothetical protein, partial [Ochrobactrum sp. POC9]|uniref:hypothetical protein n=1 Tax=Ochrobactrum sp. POC9 TaxID=2203419 RepID=UPI001AEC850D
FFSIFNEVNDAQSDRILAINVTVRILSLACGAGNFSGPIGHDNLPHYHLKVGHYLRGCSGV